jgi:hypothetical protein
MTGLGPSLSILALVAAAVACAFRQAGAMATATVAQGACVALALAVAGHLAAALVVLLFGALAMPLTVGRRLGGGSHGAPPLSATAAALAVVMIAVTIPHIGIPLALLLTGLWQVATRRDPAARILGLVTMQNGVALAAAIPPGAAWPLVALAALPIPAALLLAGIRQAWRRPA